MKLKKNKESRLNIAPYSKTVNNENKDPNNKRKTSKSKMKMNRMLQVPHQEMEQRKKLQFKPDKMQLRHKPLSLKPEAIIFYNIAPDSYFEKKLVIKNMTSKKRKISIGRPSLKNFKLEYNPVSFLAPGMSLTINVNPLFLLTQRSDSFTDS
jgi:hypothetical protein